MSAFTLNRSLHRDVGYLVCTLTALYSLSGLAVNHIEDWNPNQSRTVATVALGPLVAPGAALPALDALEREASRRAGVDPSEVRGRHRLSPTVFKVFLAEGGELVVDLPTGEGTLTRILPRRGLFEANVLHLNHLKGAWTWVADFFAVCLLFLSISGLFMLKGKQGALARGKWLIGLGLVVPAGFIAWYHWTR